MPPTWWRGFSEVRASTYWNRWFAPLLLRDRQQFVPAIGRVCVKLHLRDGRTDRLGNEQRCFTEI